MRAFCCAAIFALAMAAPAVAGVACGTKGSPMATPFTGMWVSNGGYTLEIRPTSWVHRWHDAAVNSNWTDEGYKTFEEMARAQGTTVGEVVTCISLDAEAVRELAVWTIPGDTSGAAASRIRNTLISPPYRAIQATYYETIEYFVVLDANHALDLWYEADTVDFYDLVLKR